MSESYSGPIYRCGPTIGASGAGGSHGPSYYTTQYPETKPTTSEDLIDRRLHARVGRTPLTLASIKEEHPELVKERGVLEPTQEILPLCLRFELALHVFLSFVHQLKYSLLFVIIKPITVPILAIL
jgi:hypothetical protein